MEEKRVWGIHTMDDNMFLHGNKIAIGWPEMGDLGTKGALLYLPNGRYGCAFSNAKRNCGNSPGQALRLVITFSFFHVRSLSPVCRDQSSAAGYP